jgi:hypothetical protein
MRTSGLLILLLGGLVSVCGASDSARQSASQPAAANSLSADWFTPSATVPYDSIKLSLRDLADWESRGFDSKRDGDVTCYTIQNFLVKRKRYSDFTEPYGYSTCLPSSKYSVRKVEDPGTASQR